MANMATTARKMTDEQTTTDANMWLEKTQKKQMLILSTLILKLQAQHKSAILSFYLWLLQVSLVMGLAGDRSAKDWLDTGGTARDNAALDGYISG